MPQYVISISPPLSVKSYFSHRGGYTFAFSAAKVYTSYKDANDKFMVLATANTAVALYGQVEEI